MKKRQIKVFKYTCLVGMFKVEFLRCWVCRLLLSRGKLFPSGLSNFKHFLVGGGGENAEGTSPPPPPPSVEADLFGG